MQEKKDLKHDSLLFDTLLEQLNRSIISNGGSKMTVSNQFREYVGKRKDSIIKVFDNKDYQ